MVEKSQCILVVEDNFELREGVVESLVEAGYLVEAVADGDQALRWLRGRPQDAFVVLLDLMMPSWTDSSSSNASRTKRFSSSSFPWW